MLEKKIKYTNFNGEEVEESFYFHLTEEEIYDMEMSVSGGMANIMQNIVAAKDWPEVYRNFKLIVDKSYGKKTPDGRFYKSDEILRDFKATQAYSDLFTEIYSSPNAASDFVNGIVPAKMKGAGDADLKKLMESL